MDPLTQAVLVGIGSQLVGKVWDLFADPGPSPAERAIEQQVGIGKQLIPELQRQMQGGTTPAIQASERRLKEEATRMGQTYAASARRRGVAGTIPTAAQQGRLQQGVIRGLADIRGSAAQSAQQQLAGLYAGAPMQLAGLQAAQSQEQRQMFEDIGSIMGYYQTSKDREADERWQQMYTDFLDLLRASYSAGGQSGTKSGFEWLPPGG